MGTEDWILKGIKLIINTKKQRLKIQSRCWIFKNTILKKEEEEEKAKSQELLYIFIYICEVCFKNSLFFEKQQQIIKMKIKGVIEDLKILKS